MTACNTLELIAAAYEKAVATLQKHCLAKNTAKAKIEELKADKTRVGTSIFRSLTEAYSYYARQHIHRKGVDEKVRDGEIAIQYHPEGVGAFDSDGRWHKNYNDAQIQALMLEASDAANAEYHAEQRCRELCLARDVIFRVNHATVETISFTSKAALERTIRECFTMRWNTLDEWYCGRGQPLYTSEHFEKVHKDPRNNRVKVFVDKSGVHHTVAFLHKIGPSTDIHWGMRSLGTNMYYIGDEVEQMFSMRELVERITNGKPTPDAQQAV